jgi:hypothetical protein
VEPDTTLGAEGHGRCQKRRQQRGAMEHHLESPHPITSSVTHTIVAETAAASSNLQ